MDHECGASVTSEHEAQAPASICESTRSMAHVSLSAMSSICTMRALCSRACAGGESVVDLSASGIRNTSGVDKSKERSESELQQGDPGMKTRIGYVK